MGKDTKFVVIGWKMAKLCLFLIFTDDVLLKGVGVPPYKMTYYHVRSHPRCLKHASNER